MRKPPFLSLRFDSEPTTYELNLFDKAYKFTSEQVDLSVNNMYSYDLVCYYFNNFLKRKLWSYDLWNISVRYNSRTDGYDFEIWKNEYSGA